MKQLRWLTNNFGWKILSIAVAFLLWLAIVGEPEQSMAISVPIEYKNIPTDLEISSEVPEKLRVGTRAIAKAQSSRISDFSGDHQSCLGQPTRRANVHD